MKWKRIRVFSTRREIMIYAIEGSFKESEWGALRERLFEFLHFKWVLTKVMVYLFVLSK